MEIERTALRGKINLSQRRKGAKVSRAKYNFSRIPYCRICNSANASIGIFNTALQMLLLVTAGLQIRQDADKNTCWIFQPRQV